MAGNVSGGGSFFDGRGISPSQKKFLWIAALAYAFDQMDIMNFGFIAPVLIKSYGWTMQQVANVNSYNLFGMFFGALCGGWLADRIGRRKALITSIFIFSVSSLCNAFFTSYHPFVIMRFLTGFGTIGMVTIAMGYISEMMPSETRGKYQALTIASGTIGLPVCAFFAKFVIPISQNSWRWVFILGGLGILLVFAAVKFLKESPRWLVSKGRIDEAAKVLDEISPGATLPANAVELSQNNNAGYVEALRVMFSSQYLKRTIGVLIVVFGATLGSFYLTSIYPTVHAKMGFTMAVITTLSITQTFLIPVGDFGVSFVSDKGGRKVPIVVYFLLCGGLFILQGAFSSVMAIGIVFFIRGFFSAGCMTLTWTYLAESYPTHIRASANGIMFGVCRLAASFVLFTVPMVFQNYGYFGINFVNGMLYIIPALTVLLIGQKTAGVSLEALHNKKAA